MQSLHEAVARVVRFRVSYHVWKWYYVSHMQRRKSESVESWRARQKAYEDARKADPAKHAKRNADRRARYVPRPPRGPSDPVPAVPPMHEGHELAGVSTLTNEEGEVSATWNKTRVAGADVPPVAIPESFLLRRTSVMQGGDGSTKVQWSSYDQAAVDRWESVKVAVAAHCAEHVQAKPLRLLPSAVRDDDLITLYPIGDPHIGMLAWAKEVGEHFDVRIAQHELCECFRQLVERAPASAECIITELGDFWHAENDRQQTPRGGNKLDVDGRTGKVGEIGLAILDTIIDTALAKHARVRFRCVPGNHDPNLGQWLPEIMRRTYRNEPRVIVEDGFNRYQYDAFGRNIFGWAHGDGAKVDALESIMLADEPARCGAARFRYWHTGHRHHWETKEFRTCVVETHRTLAGRDAWHHGEGYRSGRALKATAYHREWGLDSSWVVGVERVRAALGKAA